MQKPSFEQFEATSLYCPRCKAAVPVRKRLLLVLPEGDQYEYLCAYCSILRRHEDGERNSPDRTDYQALSSSKKIPSK